MSREPVCRQICFPVALLQNKSGLFKTRALGDQVNISEKKNEIIQGKSLNWITARLIDARSKLRLLIVKQLFTKFYTQTYKI